jgi:hypothetical protein
LYFLNKNNDILT